MDLKEAKQVVGAIEDHWYYKTKARMLIKYVNDSNRTALDIGAGIGFFSKFLLRNTSINNVICLDSSYDKDSVSMHHGKEIIFKRELSGRVTADLVILMDVLEHIEDDTEFLTRFVKYSEPGTNFFITVPAFNFLWSTHDVFLEHKRRYNIKTLRKTINASGLEIKSLHYYYAFIFPIVLIVRFIENIKKNNRSSMASQSFIVNFLLTYLCLFESVFSRFNKIVGVSLICHAKKIS